jgi:FkbM family methyltransferase
MNIIKSIIKRLIAAVTGGAPLMGRSLVHMRSICDGTLAWLGLVGAYFRMVVFRSSRAEHRLRLRIDGRQRDWYVVDPGEIGALWEIFVLGQYEGPLPAQANTIFDVGANSGAATAWLRTRYPTARIIAVEPDPVTAARLRRNVGADSGVTVVQAAVSDHDGSAMLARAQWTMLSHLDEHATDGVEVPTLTLESLRAEHAPRADVELLKLDTEGAEWQILASPLTGVGTVVMETHEPTPDGRPPDEVLAEVAERDGFELRPGSEDRIRWLTHTG